MILFYEQTDFLLKHKLIIKKWIKQVCKEEKKLLGDLSFIFYNSTEFAKINMEYLKHNTITDVITFDYCIKEKINGDIFINMDCVFENTKKFNNTFEKELYRVMIHGTLHLLGYKDQTKNEKKEMRKKESFYLNLLSKILIIN